MSSKTRQSHQWTRCDSENKRQRREPPVRLGSPPADCAAGLGRDHAEGGDENDSPHYLATHTATVSCTDAYGRARERTPGSRPQLRCKAPQCESPATSASNESSMDNHQEDLTSSWSSQDTDASDGGPLDRRLGHLSVNHEDVDGRPHSVRATPNSADASANKTPTTATKRAASDELQARCGRTPPPAPGGNGEVTKVALPHGPGPQKGTQRRRQVANHHPASRTRVPRRRGTEVKTDSPAFQRAHRVPNKSQIIPRDSGISFPDPCDTVMPRPNTQSDSKTDNNFAAETFTNTGPRKLYPLERRDSLFQPNISSRWPTLVLQPKSCPISNEDLKIEVQGIHAGLRMVEAKCVHLDAGQAADRTSRLGPDQWQAYVALHRTFLYEVHDLLLATQHPTAPPELRALPVQLNIPARLWKNGIHTFLEVLRHRRPESQDYMLSFICLAYQMMALLLETVPAFADTWVECLGDLARYRMAIEELKEEHLIWGATATRWYIIANDNHPSIGRLNHHLGILERPGIKKFSLYAKALTCVVPFANARESLKTLCVPLMREDFAAKRFPNSSDIDFVRFFAVVILFSDRARLQQEGSVAALKLSETSGCKLRESAVPLLVSNIAALMEFGASTNQVWRLFGGGVSVQPNPSSAEACTTPAPVSPTVAISEVQESFFDIFRRVIRPNVRDHKGLEEVLPSIHVLLAWLRSLLIAASRHSDDASKQFLNDLMNPKYISWGGISDFLNNLTKVYPVSERIYRNAHQNAFASHQSSRQPAPLPEDYQLRGLIWTQTYFPPEWFARHADVEGRDLESENTSPDRAERVLWLALSLAIRTEHLRYNSQTSTFLAPFSGPPIPEVRASAQKASPSASPREPHRDDTSQPSRSASVRSSAQNQTRSTKPQQHGSKRQTSKRPRKGGREDHQGATYHGRGRLRGKGG